MLAPRSQDGRAAPSRAPPLPSHLAVPPVRTKTHSLQKEKAVKVPAFIRTKVQLPELGVKKSVSENELSYKHHCGVENQEESAGGFAIQINIKPAVKKRTIHDFKLIRLLGSGSFGDAHLAIERRANFLCVLKILPK